MSYSIIRIQKFSSSDVKGIEIHDLRKKDGISHTNKDIDWNRTALNYDLHAEQNINYQKTVKDKISALNLPKAVRKDAVVMAQALVTSDNDFFVDKSDMEIQEFFQLSYGFIRSKFGGKNIVSATVHMDERTPHMHVNFVPVTPDGRLSAKSLFTPASLRQLQDSFHNEVGKFYYLFLLAFCANDMRDKLLFHKQN